MAEQKRETAGNSSADGRSATNGRPGTNGASAINGTDPTETETVDSATEAELKDAALNDAVLSHLPSSGPRSTAHADGNLDGAGAPAPGRSRKTEATARQSRVEPKPKRTTPAQFVRESVGELRKVVYPTGTQLANYFVVVLVFVLFIIGVVSALDLGFGWLIFRVFG